MNRIEQIKVLRAKMLSKGIRNAIGKTIVFTNDYSDKVRAGELQKEIRDYINQPMSPQLGRLIREVLEGLGAPRTIVSGRYYYRNIELK